MATLDDAAALAMALPEVTEVEQREWRCWAVAGKKFAWERTFSKADLKRYGDAEPPPYPILAVRTEGLVEKEALLADAPAGVFTIPHFDGFAAVLVELGRISEEDLREVLTEGWFAMAPAKVAATFRADG